MVELLVVIGMIGLLMGMLLPALTRARASATQASCQSNLRQVFAAQMFYASDHRGHMAGTEAAVRSAGDPSFAGLSWVDYLGKYLVKTGAAPSALVQCPSLSGDLPSNVPGEFRWSYGINTAVNLPNWVARMDRKMISPEVILMGDKALTGDDFLTTDDGCFLSLESPVSAFLTKSIYHVGGEALRHQRGKTANFVMMDGHVESLGTRQLNRAGGYWFPQKDELASLVIRPKNLGRCCGGNFDPGLPPSH